MATSQPDFDVVVIGGGPGGAATGAYLAKAGIRCLVLERETFPRPHVGESLVPASTRVFRELGFLHKMEEAGFPHKYGAAWTITDTSPLYEHAWDGLSPDCYANIRFDERPQPGVPQNYTYHVDRAKFDQLLLEHAAELGADVRFQSTALGVDFSDPSVVRITYRADGTEHQVTCRLVVDASGRRTLLGHQLGVRVRDRHFDQYALHTWVTGYDRTAFAQTPLHADYLFVHFLPIDDTWIWQIPITEEITSIGLVTQKQNLKRAASQEELFWDAIASRPAVADGLRQAERLRPLRAEGDYSYAMRQICGDRFVLVGDAARFVDPIFATGVSIALSSARFAAQDILAACETDDFSHAQFTTFETTMKRGARNWYRFIAVYYRLNVLYTAFVSDDRYRFDMLRLLQGDVWDEDEPVALTKMTEILKQVESNPKHIWHSYLGNLKADDLALALAS